MGYLKSYSGMLASSGHIQGQQGPRGTLHNMYHRKSYTESNKRREDMLRGH